MRGGAAIWPSLAAEAVRGGARGCKLKLAARVSGRERTHLPLAMGRRKKKELMIYRSRSFQHAITFLRGQRAQLCIVPASRLSAILMYRVAPRGSSSPARSRVEGLRRGLKVVSMRLEQLSERRI